MNTCMVVRTSIRPILCPRLPCWDHPAKPAQTEDSNKYYNNTCRIVLTRALDERINNVMRFNMEAHMREQLYVRDTNGNIIQRSRNLVGIRRYVSNHLIKQMSLTNLSGGPHSEGKLCILFDDGASFETNFASYAVLIDFVSRWRNVYGAKCALVSPDGTVHTVAGSQLGREGKA